MEKLAVIEELLETARRIQKMLPPGHSIVFVSAEKENVITERIFTNEIKKQLKQRIKGDLSVHIVDDTLIVDIQPVGCYTYHYTINNLSVQISTCLSSRIVADVIVKQHKKYILSQHFPTK